jgi:hypothetical protein
LLSIFQNHNTKKGNVIIDHDKNNSNENNKQTTIAEEEPIKVDEPILDNQRSSVQIDQLEFEASRSLLKFFEPDHVVSSNFEHLLPPPKEVLPKKTISLRHKWSLYRPTNKMTVKRSISTPNFLD